VECDKQSLDEVYEKDLFQKAFQIKGVIILVMIPVHIIINPVIRMFARDNGRSIFQPMLMS